MSQVQRDAVCTALAMDGSCQIQTLNFALYNNILSHYFTSNLLAMIDQLSDLLKKLFGLEDKVPPSNRNRVNNATDVHGNSTNRDVHGNSTNRDVHGNSTNKDVHGNRTDTDIHGNRM